jgi:hypothetical protein
MEPQDTDFMTELIEQVFAAAWNMLARRKRLIRPRTGLLIGYAVSADGATRQPIVIPFERRSGHVVIWGRTGSGKSRAMLHMAVQDIRADNGLLWIDNHGDSIPFLLQQVRSEERRRGIELHDRVILIEPSDLVASVGLNLLEPTGQSNFVLIAEIAHILKQRWGLEHFGARTEELLRNSLFVLADNQLTLIEITPLLTNAAYRERLLANTHNAEVRQYFELRYGQMSEAMQAVMRDPILNKVSYISSDPAFRHIFGQQRSTINLVDAIDSGAWILLNLSKGELGEQAQTLGSLFLTKFKSAIFRRQNRTLFTAYCDEIQNLIAFDEGFEVLLSEARKFGIGIVTANQFLEQISPVMRAAMLAVQNHLAFRLSSPDAEKIATALNGDRNLSALLRTLAQRHAVLQTGTDSAVQIEVPPVHAPQIATGDLRDRIRQRWARPRADIEREIQARQPRMTQQVREELHDWE